MDHLQYIQPHQYFEVTVAPADEALAAKRQEFIQMLEDLYQIGWLSVAAMDFKVADRGKKLYQIVYLNISITGKSFYVKATLQNETKVLNSMLRYSNASSAKAAVSRYFRKHIQALKEQHPEA